MPRLAIKRHNNIQDIYSLDKDIIIIGKDDPDKSDLILLTTIANHTATGIERVMLNEKIQEEALVRGNLERFFSPYVADKITRESIATGGLTLIPAKVTASILFSDIKGFTLLTERFGPDEIACLLRDYFTLMTDIIFKYNGTLDKYIGDAIMAIFGAPEPYNDHAEKAVATALEIKTILRLN